MPIPKDSGIRNNPDFKTQEEREIDRTDAEGKPLPDRGGDLGNKPTPPVERDRRVEESQASIAARRTGKEEPDSVDAAAAAEKAKQDAAKAENERQAAREKAAKAAKRR